MERRRVGDYTVTVDHLVSMYNDTRMLWPALVATLRSSSLQNFGGLLTPTFVDSRGFQYASTGG